MKTFDTEGGVTNASLFRIFNATGKTGKKVSEFGVTSTAEQVAKDWNGNGKVVIVTGPYSGLGKETVRVLASRGAEVVLAGRSKSKADAAMAEFKSQNPSAKLRFLQLDLSSLSSVKRFVADFRTTGLELNALVNNAGVMACPFALSTDGHEMQFATNHLGHFLLTELLLPELEASAKKTGQHSRVVTLSSAAHHKSYKEGIRFTKLDSKEGYTPWNAYGQSKLANILFTRELESRMRESGRPITAVAVHPGAVPTELVRHSNPFLAAVMMGLVRITMPSYRPIPVGAACQVYLTTAKEVKGGEYYMDCAVMPTSATAIDREMAKRLWETSEEICGEYMKN